MKFQCTSCDYIEEKDELPKRCSYCGENGTMTKAKEAQDFLNEP